MRWVSKTRGTSCEKAVSVAGCAMKSEASVWMIASSRCSCVALPTRILVDLTGGAVQRGEPLVLLYSPELVSAQEELLAARRAETALEASRSTRMRESAAATLEAAREKIVEGKMRKYYEQHCLLDQAFVKDESGKTVEQVLKDAIAGLGETARTTLPTGWSWNMK